MAKRGRGLEGGISRSAGRLVAHPIAHGGARARNQADLPALTEGQILAWADAHHARTGEWPRCTMGPIAEAPGEEWRNVDAVLREGLRGLPAGSSLPRLLSFERGVRNEKDLPPLTIPQILRWADAYYGRHGSWPTIEAGPITEAPAETCAAFRGHFATDCAASPAAPR